jgi:hypothetical protein
MTLTYGKSRDDDMFHVEHFDNIAHFSRKMPDKKTAGIAAGGIFQKLELFYFSG